MAVYTVKTLNKSSVSMKINDVDERQFVSLPFTVVELGFSDTVLFRKGESTVAKVKAQIKAKIKAELVRLAEHKEYQVEV